MAKVTKITTETLRNLRKAHDADVKLVADTDTILATLPKDSAARGLLLTHRDAAADRVKNHEAAITRFIFKAVVSNAALFDLVTEAVESTLKAPASQTAAKISEV